MPSSKDWIRHAGEGAGGSSAMGEKYKCSRCTYAGFPFSLHAAIWLNMPGRHDPTKPNALRFSLRRAFKSKKASIELSGDFEDYNDNSRLVEPQLSGERAIIPRAVKFHEEFARVCAEDLACPETP